MLRRIFLLGCAASCCAFGGVPFELTSNKIYVPANINGHGPYWFVLDTGSVANVIDANRARSLGISTHGNFPVYGAGPGSLPAGMAKDVTLNVNDASLPRQEVEVIPVNRAISFSEGHPIDGLLGCPFFQVFIVEIDYIKRHVNFYARGADVRKSGASAIPFRIENGNIFIRTFVTLPDGKRIEAKFLVDTGWRAAVSLTAPFVREHRLLAGTATIRATAGVGIGGAVTSAIGRLKALEIGNFTIRNPFSEFFEGKEGVLTQSDIAGIIGGEILRRFDLVLDYPGNSMIIIPNRSFPDPYDFDMSGIYLTAAGADLKLFRIYSVIAKSPAAEAGLRAGDFIETVDGHPSSKFTVEQLRQMWKEEGKEYRLGIRRDGDIFETKIRLRRLI